MLAIVDKDAISYLEGYQEGKQEGKQEGIRDVVEWIEHHGGTIDGVRNQWQAQLKEWGIK